MIITPYTRLASLCSDECGRSWSLRGWLKNLLQSRQELLRVTRLARRERRRLGFRHIPQRVWDRRSALFVER
jgi:hypothetical protein